MKKKWLVVFREINVIEVEVEAKDEKNAIEKVKKIIKKKELPNPIKTFIEPEEDWDMYSVHSTE